jgi:type III pantothenate kinase
VTEPNALLAVDIGNSRTKVGRFDLGDFTAAGDPPKTLPMPVRTVLIPASSRQTDSLPGEMKPDFGGEPLATLVDDLSGPARWFTSSVHRPSLDRLSRWIADRRRGDGVVTLDAGDFPLVLDVENPERVGIDRLAAATAADRLREPGEPAVIVDLGTAVTVDLLSADGIFRGGAILPGVAMSARALFEQTDQLPQSDMVRLDDPPPPPLGRDTAAAIRSGLYWGAVGAVGELVDRLGRTIEACPAVFLTGGAAPSIAEHFGSRGRYVPDMVLRGVALVAYRRLTTDA